MAVTYTWLAAESLVASNSPSSTSLIDSTELGMVTVVRAVQSSYEEKFLVRQRVQNHARRHVLHKRTL